MRSFLLTFIIGALSACDRSVTPPPEVAPSKAAAPVDASRADVIQFAFPKPLPRAHLITTSDLVAAPESYNGKRVILAGTYTGGWETADFQLDGATPDFSIWAEFDWKEINLPFGDFAESGRKWGRAKPSEVFAVRYRVVAEGTFYFRRSARPLGMGGEPGFGHFGVSKATFLIDRLFELEPLAPETPNKAPEPTTTSVTSPAAQETRQP